MTVRELREKLAELPEEAQDLHAGFNDSELGWCTASAPKVCSLNGERIWSRAEIDDSATTSPKVVNLA